jgi:hypothetical protein
MHQKYTEKRMYLAAAAAAAAAAANAMQID